MSTKATSRALAAMRSCIKSGEPWTAEMEAAYDAATSELEAIRKAARALDDGLPLQVVGVGIQEALDLVTSIAKEGP